MEPLTKQWIERLLTHEFEEGFALQRAALVEEPREVEVLFSMATAPSGYVTRSVEAAQLAFRAAFVLEAYLLGAKERLESYGELLIRYYPLAANGSVHRHFTKLMALALQRKALRLTPEQQQLVAECTAEWMLLPATRVAVKIWAMEVLFVLLPRVAWLNEVMPDLIELLRKDETPAMRVRLRRWGFA